MKMTIICVLPLSANLWSVHLSPALFPPGSSLLNNQCHSNSETSPSNGEKQPGPDDWLCGQIEEREREWRTERSTYRALQTALLISSSLVKDSLQLNAKALNSFYEFSITPKPDEADESPDRHKSISSRSHSLTESRKRRLHSNRRDKKGEEK